MRLPNKKDGYTFSICNKCNRSRLEERHKYLYLWCEGKESWCNVELTQCEFYTPIETPLTKLVKRLNEAN